MSQVNTTVTSWADNILRLGLVQRTTSTTGYASLEAEVNAYLAEPPVAVTIIGYWQVR